MEIESPMINTLGKSESSTGLSNGFVKGCGDLAQENKVNRTKHGAKRQ